MCTSELEVENENGIQTRKGVHETQDCPPLRLPWRCVLLHKGYLYPWWYLHKLLSDVYCRACTCRVTTTRPPPPQRVRRGGAACGGREYHSTLLIVYSIVVASNCIKKSENVPGILGVWKKCNNTVVTKCIVCAGNRKTLFFAAFTPFCCFCKICVHSSSKPHAFYGNANENSYCTFLWI